MLTYLHIADLGVIADATIEPAPGLTAVTGETGAGKTLVVTGLGMLLGQRTDAGLVRQGSTKAVVDGGFLGLDLVAERLDEVGAELDGDEAPELVVSRQVTAQGRTRASLGGVAVPLSVLDDVVGELATIHGQSEQVRLATPERARQVLDQAGGPELAPVLARYRADYASRRAAAAERDELVTQVQARAREADMLRYGLGEIEKVLPAPGEDESLAAEARRLQEVDDLRGLAAEADAALSGDDETFGAVGLIGQARKALERLSQHDETTAELAAQSVTALDAAQGLAGEVASYLASLEADPMRLEAIAARQAELQSLTRKYGTTIDDVLEWARVSSVRLEQLVGSDERIAELDEQIARLDEQLAALASEITELRAQAGERVSGAVVAELAALAMPHAAIEFELRPLPDLGPWGAESVQLLFTANPGSPLAPIAKVASGGELSRLRLAIEVVLADLEAVRVSDVDEHVPGGTFVFDEVDAGVGGAVGLEIGRRLARLAKDSQVLVVTHLAQVAAWADRHYVVAKSDDGAITTAGVYEVTGDNRVAEIARMMGGLSGSAAGLEHARDLLAVAGEAG